MLKDLWGRIADGAPEGGQLIVCKVPTEAKVCQFDGHITVYKYVVWLQVPMDDAPLVAVLYH